MKIMKFFSLSALAIVLPLGLVQGCEDSSDDGAPESSRQPEIGDQDAAGDEVSVDAGKAESDAAVASGSDAGKADSGPAASTIVDIAVANGAFKTLVQAVMDAELVSALSGAEPLTVFAPTDAAFAKLPAGTLSSLSKADLTAILTYHVVSGTVLSSDLKAGPVKTLSGLSAFVSLEGGAKINNAKVTQADIKASNGVIHVIDTVLLPPNLVEAASYAGGFSSLLAAATKADLAGTLSAKGANLTVFAPTDAAFTTLGKATVDGLSVSDLKNVLLYHVVSGKVLSTDLKAGSVPSLLPGKSLNVSLTSGVQVNDAKVVLADVVATNGVIHVIDKVLLPPTN